MKQFRCYICHKHYGRDLKPKELLTLDFCFDCRTVMLMQFENQMRDPGVPPRKHIPYRIRLKIEGEERPEP